MVTSQNRRHVFAVLATVAMLVLSACGGGDGNEELDALRQAKIISDKQAEDLKNMLRNVRAACRNEAQATMAQIVANPQSFPPQAFQLLAGAANADPNKPGDDSCARQMTEYRLLAASFQNEAQRAAAERDKARQREIDNLMNTNQEFKDKVLLALIKAIGSEANYIQNYNQLMMFASTYQGRIAEAAAQFGFSPQAVAQLNAELGRVQALTALRLAAQGGGTSGSTSGGGVANGGSLGITGGSGMGGGSGSGFGGISFGQSGYGANTNKGVSNGGALNIGGGQGASSGGSKLNLKMGSGSRTAMRLEDQGIVQMAQNDKVLALKRSVGGLDWFAKRRRANVTAH